MNGTRARYLEDWLQRWDEAIDRELRPGIRILDAGSGRRPAISRERLPAGSEYVGLDLSMAELEAAPPGSYDEMVEADVAEFRPELEGRFDLVVSWQVLEHVMPLDQALENLKRYLVPGGVLLAQLSGRFSLFALVNRVLPYRLGKWAMQHLLKRDPKTVFPAHYDQCWYGALVRLTSTWKESEVLPRYRGSVYFKFLAPLEKVYLRYEDWTIEHGHANLATHYLISARR